MSQEITEPQLKILLPEKPKTVAEAEQEEADAKAQHTLDVQRALVKQLFEDDKDILELSETQRKMVRDALALTKMTLVTRHKVAKAMRNDPKFNAVMEKVSWYHLMSYTPYVHAELALGALKGKRDYVRMFLQVTGKMPVGGKMMAPPENDLQSMSREELDQKIDDLIAKRKAKKSGGK